MFVCINVRDKETYRDKDIPSAMAGMDQAEAMSSNIIHVPHEASRNSPTSPITLCLPGCRIAASYN